jgi:hypothetical protein
MTMAAQNEADKKGLVLSGRLMNDSFLNQYYDTNSNQNSFAYSGKTTIRLNVINADHSQAKVQSDLDIVLLYGELADTYNLFLMNTNQSYSLSGNNLTLLFTLRQLYLALYPSFADISIGRQIINFGVGMIFSPINVFSSFDPTDIDFTRTGSDAARVKVPIGDLGGLDLISTFTTKMTNSTSAVKLFGNFFGFDFSGVAIYHGTSREIITGATFKGDVEIGIHGEFVEHFFIDSDKPYFEGMLGIDYSFFDSQLALFLEYYYDESSIDPSTVTLRNIASINRIFYNKHYFFLEGIYSIDEIRKVSAFIIYNPLDNAFEVVASYTQNIFQNANLTGYIQYFQNNLNGLTFLKTPALIYALRLEVLF